MDNNQLEVTFFRRNGDYCDVSIKSKNIEEPLRGEEELNVFDGKGEYRLRLHGFSFFPVYSFGYWYNNPQQRPGHGGEWSSRAAVVNPIFGTKLFELAINNAACSVDKDDLTKILPEGYALLLRRSHENSNEMVWRVILPNHLFPEGETMFTHVVTLPIK